MYGSTSGRTQQYSDGAIPHAAQNGHDPSADAAFVALYAPVPQELKDRSQWVMRNKKVPYNAHTGKKASSTDPATWTSFADVVAGIVRWKMEGIGYNFSASDPYTGIDLDNCLLRDGDDDTTVRLKDWAQEIVSLLNSYTEISPSGTGVHIFVRATLPEWLRHKQHYHDGIVEVYDEGRYFTMTGRALGDTPRPIAKRPQEVTTVQQWVWGEAWKQEARPIDALGRYAEPPFGPTGLSDEEVLQRCRTDRNGDAFIAAYDHGDIAEYHDDDDSVADWFVLGKLCFYCGAAPEQIERLATQGQHYLHADDPKLARQRREKWQRHDSAYGTFIKEQIAKRLAGRDADEVFQGAQEQRTHFTLLSYDELALLPEPKPLIRSILDAEKLTFLYGRSGRWKSFLALSWALAIAHGKSWLGYATEAGVVVYIAYEGANEYKHRIAAWRRHYGMTDSIPRLILIPGGVHLLDAKHITVLMADIKAKLGADTPVLLVIDTISRAMAGGNENDTKDAQAMIAAADKLRLALQCSLLFVHHTGHDPSRMRGNSVFYNDSDMVWKIASPSDAPKLRHGEVVLLTNEKNRSHGGDDRPILLTTTRIEWMDQQTCERLSSLVITRAEVASHTVDAADAPSSPPKKDFTAGERALWRELVKFCAHTPEGATFTQWYERLSSKGAMAKSTFAAGVKRLVELEWVIKKDKRYRAVNPYDSADALDDDDDDGGENT